MFRKSPNLIGGLETTVFRSVSDLVQAHKEGWREAPHLLNDEAAEVVKDAKKELKKVRE